MVYFWEGSFNVIVYEMLRVCVRGFSEGKSEASKQGNDLWLSLNSNFLYTMLYLVFFDSE